jgi:hypothetical protein
LNKLGKSWISNLWAKSTTLGWEKGDGRMGYWYLLFGTVLVVFMVFLYRRLVTFGKGLYHHKASHLVIITNNSQQSIEWLIRSYHLANFLRAGGLKKGRITCLDMGSSDDTLLILQRLKQKYDQLDVFSHKLSSEEELTEWLRAEQKKEKVVVLDLRDIDEDRETA